MKRTILMNPGPVTTTPTVKNALLVEDICHREAAFTSIIQSIRLALLTVAQADCDYTSVLFASSGTGAIEACISSVMPQDKALAVINNGAYGQRLVDIARRYSIPVVELSYAPEKPLPLSIIEACIKDNPQIAYVALVHHETSIGILNPLQAIGAICCRERRGFIVDAMSSFAGTDIHMARDHIDFLISSSNKCLQGMPGIAFVIGKKSVLLASKGLARSYYFDLYQQYQMLELSGQLPFTPPVHIVYALKQALDELLVETVLGRIKRYHDNYDCLVTGLNALGFKNITPSDRESKLLLTVQYPNDGFDYTFDALHDALFKEGVTIYPAKTNNTHTFRLACIGDLTRGDMDTFLHHLRQYQGSHYVYQSDS